MIATPNLRCVVVVASGDSTDAEVITPSTATRPRFRPSELLPWADPHIRSLVEQLQEEVRAEAAAARAAFRREEQDQEQTAPALQPVC